MQQRVRTASVLGVSALMFLWLSGCHDDPELLGELMTGGTTQAGGESSLGGVHASSGGVTHGGTMSSGGTAAHAGQSASGGAQSGGAQSAGGAATEGGVSVAQGGSGILEAGAGASSAGSGGSSDLPELCGAIRCNAPLVCVAVRVIGGALQLPDDQGDCPQGRHLETVGSTTRCENDFSYRCVAQSGCEQEPLSCACGAATCPSEYPSCFDPGADSSMLSPATALVCELLAP